MNMTDWPVLTSLILLPIIGGFFSLLLQQQAPQLSKRLAFGFAILTFIVSLCVLWQFDKTTAAMQFVERVPWIPSLHIDYYLGVDGISLPLVLLTTLMTPFAMLAGWSSIQQRAAQYMAAFLIMEGLIIGVFIALDAILFYVFFEAMLIPMFLIIGIWGGPNRVYASIKFFLYTFFGSVLLLLAFIYMYLQTLDSGINSFAILEFYQLPLSLTEQSWIFLAFLLAFGVKVPMWPVHTWLPDAHVEAPTGGSVILAAITLKIGGYGFLRLALPITADAGAHWVGVVIALSLIAIVYIGLVALAQQDMKKLIAYSSIAHMGFVTLGLFIVFAADTQQAALLGLQGAMVQMLSHGLISAALFLSVGVLYDRMHTRNISDYGGVANTMPLFASLMLLFAMANAGLPGTSGFVGEFMVILASLQANIWYAVLAATTLVLGAAYTLWMIKRVIFGAVANAQVQALCDINRREFVLLLLLALLILLLGVWPQPVLYLMQPSVENTLSLIMSR